MDFEQLFFGLLKVDSICFEKVALALCKHLVHMRHVVVFRVVVNASVDLSLVNLFNGFVDHVAGQERNHGGPLGVVLLTETLIHVALSLSFWAHFVVGWRLVAA